MSNYSGARLEQWSTYRDAYTAPEVPPRLQGKAGDRFILTSCITRAEGHTVWTESGSRYELGEPDPKWLEWLASNDYQFDPENPIKTVKS